MKIPYTRKDIAVFVSYNGFDFLGMGGHRVYFMLKKDGDLHDLYYANDNQDYDADEWWEWMNEEIIPSMFMGATEVEYEFSGDFSEVPRYLFDCGFRDIQLFGYPYLK